MRKVKLVLYFLVLITICVFAILFARENSQLISINFLGWETPLTHLWIIVVIAFFVGFLLSLSLMSYELIKISLYYRRKKKLEND